MNAVIQCDSDDHAADSDCEKLGAREDENGQSRSQQSREKRYRRKQQTSRVSAVDENHKQRQQDD